MAACLHWHSKATVLSKEFNKAEVALTELTSNTMWAAVWRWVGGCGGMLSTCSFDLQSALRVSTVFRWLRRW